MFKFIVFIATIILTVKARNYQVDVAKTEIIQTPYTKNIVKVDEGDTTYELTWLVDVDEKTNPIKMYYNILRRIDGENVWKLTSVENLCSESDNQVTKNRQISFLHGFGNTESCPIKKGSKAVVQDQTTYLVPHPSPICGPFASRMDIVSVEFDIIIATIMFKGNITGEDC